MAKETITLYYKEGTSDKVYQATIEDSSKGLFVVNFAFGRRGTTLQTGTKTQTPVDYAKAKKVYDSVVNEKIRKGYILGVSDSTYATVPKVERDSGIHCQLLNAIDEDEAKSYLSDDKYWAQEKKNGRRILLVKSGGNVSAVNRKGQFIGISDTLTQAVQAIKGDFVLDGEAIGDKVFVFDLLSIGDKDLKPEAYATRLGQLEILFKGISKGLVILVPTAKTTKEKTVLFNSLQLKEAEGIVLKDPKAPYTAGKPNSGGSQLKFKFYATASVIVDKVNEKRSVAMCLLDAKGKRVEAGNVTIPPNKAIPKAEEIIEVKYLYAYKESGHLYQPTFLMVRDDIPQKDCKVSQLKYFVPEEEV